MEVEHITLHLKNFFKKDIYCIVFKLWFLQRKFDVHKYFFYYFGFIFAILKCIARHKCIKIELRLSVRLQF